MDDLNLRQQRYLSAAYQIDQAQEQAHKGAFQRGNWEESRRPASEWRWVAYGRWLDLPGAPPTPLREAVQEVDEVDEGTGSTWAALARRGLLEMRDREVRGYRLPHVRLTPKGRKLARELGGKQHERRPKGVLSEWTWRALALAWQAGDEGVPGEGGGHYGRIGWGTWLGLRNRPGGDLVEEFMHHRVPMPLTYNPHHSEEVYHVRLTPRGRAYYTERWAANRQAYPHIEAPEPSQVDHSTPSTL